MWWQEIEFTHCSFHPLRYRRICNRWWWWSSPSPPPSLQSWTACEKTRSATPHSNFPIGFFSAHFPLPTPTLTRKFPFSFAHAAGFDWTSPALGDKSARDFPLTSRYINPSPSSSPLQPSEPHWGLKKSICARSMVGLWERGSSSGRRNGVWETELPMVWESKQNEYLHHAAIAKTGYGAWENFWISPSSFICENWKPENKRLLYFTEIWSGCPFKKTVSWLLKQRRLHIAAQKCSCATHEVTKAVLKATEISNQGHNGSYGVHGSLKSAKNVSYGVGEVVKNQIGLLQSLMEFVVVWILQKLEMCIGLGSLKNILHHWMILR